MKHYSTIPRKGWLRFVDNQHRVLWFDPKATIPQLVAEGVARIELAELDSPLPDDVFTHSRLHD